MQKDKSYEIENYFSTKIKEVGASSVGVGWNGNEAQRIRYDQLVKLIDFETTSTICDYGCGYGYFLGYLRKLENSWKGSYTGYDLSYDMIKEAHKIYGKDDVGHSFKVGSEIEGQFDYIVESGVFNLKFENSDMEWKEYILSTLDMFHAHSKKGFAFNALTKYSDKDKMRDELYYADPLELFDYCKRNFSRNVALLHDYELYDFTIIVRK